MTLDAHSPGRKSFSGVDQHPRCAQGGARKYPASIDPLCLCTRLLYIQHLRQKPGDIPRSLPCCDVELFLMGGSLLPGVPGGCDNLTG